MKELTVTAQTESLDDVLDLIYSETEKLGFSRKITIQISVAVEEIFINIVNYSYVHEGKVRITFGVEDKSSDVVITFTDDGMQYNPLENPDPDITLPASKRRIGGLGIYMVKRIMTSVEYEYTNNQNKLTLRKYLN